MVVAIQKPKRMASKTITENSRREKNHLVALLEKLNSGGHARKTSANNGDLELGPLVSLGLGREQTFRCWNPKTKHIQNSMKKFQRQTKTIMLKMWRSSCSKLPFMRDRNRIRTHSIRPPHCTPFLLMSDTMLCKLAVTRTLPVRLLLASFRSTTAKHGAGIDPFTWLDDEEANDSEATPAHLPACTTNPAIATKIFATWASKPPSLKLARTHTLTHNPKPLEHNSNSVLLHRDHRIERQPRTALETQAWRRLGWMNKLDHVHLNGWLPLSRRWDLSWRGRIVSGYSPGVNLTIPLTLPTTGWMNETDDTLFWATIFCSMWMLTTSSFYQSLVDVGKSEGFVFKKGRDAMNMDFF